MSRFYVSSLWQNVYLKDQNQKYSGAKDRQDQQQQTFAEEKRRIVDYYKEQMERLRQTVEELTIELQKKVSVEKVQDGVQINTFNTQNFINMTPPSIQAAINNSGEKSNGPKKVLRRRKMSDDECELKLLELESSTGHITMLKRSYHSSKYEGSADAKEQRNA